MPPLVSMDVTGRSQPHAPETRAGRTRLRSGGLPCSGGTCAVIRGSDGTGTRSAHEAQPGDLRWACRLCGQDIGGARRRHPRPRPGHV